MTYQTSAPNSHQLSVSDLRRIVPAAFATSPHPAVSEVYEFVPTEPIVESLLGQGWTIRSAHQNNMSDVFASHRIVFDLPQVPQVKAVDDVWPTATLFNSHNRTRRVQFGIGFFRTICSNQAQVSVLSEGLTKIHIKGWGGVDTNEVINNVLNVWKDLPVRFAQMQGRYMSPSERIKFGAETLSLRTWGTVKFSNQFDAEKAELFMQPRREADRHDDLWHVYNVAQERLLHGTVGGVQDVARNKTLNLRLWEHAQTYLSN